MSEQVENFVDKNGNFTHAKVAGTPEQILELINKYKESGFYASKTESQKIIFEMYVFPEIIKTGMMPQGLLLELVMPSVTDKIRFDDVKIGQTITFDLPPKFKKEDTND